MGLRIPGTRIRKRLVAILFLLITSSVFSLDMEISPNTLITGRIITLKFETDILITEDISVSNIILPNDLNLISGPVIRPYYKRVDGRSLRFHQITWAVKSNASGVFNLSPLELAYNNEIFEIKIPEIRVYNSDEIYNNYPLIVEWNKDIQQEIYVGESLPLVVEAYNLEEINFPEKVVSTKPRKGEIIEVSGLGDINPEKVGESDLYRVPVASWIYTPFEAGNVVIPAVRVDMNGLTRYTDSLLIKVLPLPEVNATGGVGEFIISTELSNTQVTPADVFHYKVRITGQGNLPYIKFPNLDYTGLILIDKNETESIDSSDNGFLGWKEIDFSFQAIDSGVKEISLSDVSWIDHNGNEIFYNGNITHINVVSVKVIEEDILPFLSFMRTTDIISSYNRFMYKNPYMWSLLGISFFILIVTTIFKSFKLSKEKKGLLITVAIMSLFFTSSIFVKGFEYQGNLVMADNYIDSGNFEDALLIYDDLTSKLPYNYGLFINKSILWDKLGNISRAVYNIRIAERISPDNKKINDIKNYLSDSEESRQKQAKTSNNFNPDYIFFVLVLFFNLMILALYKLFSKKNITVYSLLFIAILFTTLSSVLLILVDVKNGVNAGVIISGGAELTKVPNEQALKWIDLGEGNCVYIRSEWEDKFLIETEYGLQGWVSKEKLLVLEER